MPQAVWGWGTDVGVADNPFGLGKSDFSNCLVKKITNPLIMQPLIGFAGQKVRISIICRQQSVAKGEIIRQMPCYINRDGDQAILSELCLSNIDCPFVSSEILEFQP
jgi:hypothetical protein